MSHIVARIRPVVLGAFALLSLLPACSDDKDTLVLVSTPVTAYPTAAKVEVTVTPTGAAAVIRDFTAAEANSGNLGVLMPHDTSGSAAIAVVVLDAGNNRIAQGATTATGITAGGKAGPFAVALSPITVAGVDGGAGDAGTPPADGPTSAQPDTQMGMDRQTVDTGASDVAADIVHAEDVGADVSSVQPDTGPAGLDTAADAPLPDAPLGKDLGPDVSPDLPTTMNVLAHCTQYTHTATFGTGDAATVADFGVRQLVFSPDGKTLVSFGEDGRAKLWNVSATGLAETSVIFTGDRNMHGAISPDGKYVAVGDESDDVTVYDLAASLQYGSASSKWALAPSLLTPEPGDGATRLQFTTDGSHLVVFYDAFMQPEQNQLVVWDLGTQLVARVVKYDYDEKVKAIFPGSYTDAMWVASARTYDTDGGDAETEVTLMDVSQASPSKAQFRIAGTVNTMAFSPDGSTLAVGLDEGEVSLWDITSKSNISRLGSPLIPSSSTNSTVMLAYTPDGKYLAVDVGVWAGTSSAKIVSLQLKQSLQHAITYYPWSLAFAPDGLALAIGERDDGIIDYCHP